jgi:hypothetical protein
MKAVLILVLIVAVCTCSASNSEMKRLPEKEGQNKSTLAAFILACVRSTANSETKRFLAERLLEDQWSQADEEEQYYNEFVEKLRKDGEHKLEGIRKRARGQEKKYKFLIRRLGQGESFTTEDKEDAISFFCKVFKLKKDASENLIERIYSAAHMWSFKNFHFVSSEVRGIFCIMDALGYEVLGWRRSRECIC